MLTWPDYAVLVGSLLVLLAIGGAFARQQHDTLDFFLARRRVPWWAACLSFLATEVSAVTIISVPTVRRQIGGPPRTRSPRWPCY